ncbi:MAG: SDR family NAD(P)-dependent oxidoreductase [Lacibacter sp.]
MEATKTVLVTGGSRGLGKNMALQLAQKGFNIILTYNSRKDEADNVVTEIEGLGTKAAALQLDVAQANSFDAFILSLQSVLATKFNSSELWAVVNNAGMGAYGKIVDSNETTLDLMYNIHVKAPFLLSQKIYPLLSEHASVLNISSGLTRFSLDGYAPYAIMKGAVDTLTKYQAKEFAAKKIRVNVLAPGAIETDFGGGAVRDNKDLNSFIASQTALGRVGVPDDIGSVAAFLCSNEARWINAQRIEVSGGIHI